MEAENMLSKKIEDLLNNQIEKEFYSAYLYLSMSAWLNNYGLNGYAHWFRVQAQEERDHALIFMNYIIKANGRVHLNGIEEPNFEFASVEELLQLNLDHEKLVTSLIYAIASAATAENDFKTMEMVKWFVTEQVEEEASATENINGCKLFGGDGKGLFMLDSQKATRVYTIAPPLAAQPM
jgi:ferritin